jgi:transcriptional regulator with XRE-family HTH domain
MITGEQIRAARGLTRLDQAELAERAGISLETIKRLERLRGPISANTTTEAAIRAAFAAIDVVFIEEDGHGYGVRFRRPAEVRSRQVGRPEIDSYA